MARRKDNAKKWAVGAVFAGIAGYVAGILTAPKSGKETREDIVDKAGDMRSDSEEQLQKARDDLSEALKNARAKTSELSSKAKGEYDEAVVGAKDALNKGGSVLKAWRAGEAQDPDLNKAIKQLKQAQKNLSKYLKG
jgi:gas vesicle protein